MKRKTKMPRKAVKTVTEASGRKKATKPRPKAATKPAKAAASQEPKETKAEQLRKFLQTPGGVTSAEIETKFGWLPHSVRSAISKTEGVTKTKREGHGGGRTVYSLPPA